MKIEGICRSMRADSVIRMLVLLERGVLKLCPASRQDYRI